MFFSVIYGNIAQFIQNVYAAGTRYRQRIGDLKEFAAFHRLSPSLRQKIYNYVDFQWSVTNGIDVDKIAAGLPPHLQLEMKVQLNKTLVEKVTLFVGCPRAFFEALVCKLQPCICVQGDYVFYKGEFGTNMYFLRRGLAEVLTAESVVLATLREGDYFGEMALLADAPRSADVRAVTDLVMLSLSSEDLNEVLEVYPQARVRMRSAAADRLKKLEAQDKSKAKEKQKEAPVRQPKRTAARNRRMSWGASDLNASGAVEAALSLEPCAAASATDAAMSRPRRGSDVCSESGSFVGRRLSCGSVGRRGSLGARSTCSLDEEDEEELSPGRSARGVRQSSIDRVIAAQTSRSDERVGSIITPLSSFSNTKQRRDSVGLPDQRRGSLPERRRRAAAR